MSEREIEPFGCAVCGRTQTVAMTERGPVKGELERQRIGNFLFCVECLATSVESDEGDIHVLTMTAGPMRDHRWLTGANERLLPNLSPLADSRKDRRVHNV